MTKHRSEKDRKGNSPPNSENTLFLKKYDIKNRRSKPINVKDNGELSISHRGNFQLGYYNGLTKKGWLESCPSIIDYSEFPATRYYIQKYSLFPSSVRYECVLNYVEFIKKVKSIPKSFYCDASNQYNSYDENKKTIFHTDFICLEVAKIKLVLYITISSNGSDEIMKYLDPLHGKFFNIVGIYNPIYNPNEMLEYIRNLIGLPEIPLEDKNGSLNILVQGKDGYGLESKKITCPDIDFNLNYNYDFEPIHNLIVEKLSVDNSKGLVLLHGDPGSGKTTYIRYLINVLKKRVIYIPPNMVNVISDPQLIKFFITHSNSVLVIEDAENVLMRRSQHSTQAIANILNLSDGLLSDCANIQIVASFNTDLKNIDEALLRKGRLIAKYKFESLSSDRVEMLSKKLCVDISGLHLLSDIYNAADKSFNESHKIGFK